MKIGYFVTHFPYDKPHPHYYCGGVEIVASNLAANMLQRGHELSVFTTSVDRQDSIESYKTMTIYRYGNYFRIGQANMSLNLLFGPLRHEVDIVHAHAGNPPAPLAALRYAKKKKKPLIVSYHGDPQKSWGGIIRWASVFLYDRYLLSKILSHANVIISSSEYYIGQSRFLAKHRHKITVIPNGININDFCVPYSKKECREKLGLLNEKYVILYVGALSPYKGPDVLVKAMPKILVDAPNTKLIFVGEGVLREELEKEVKELGIGSKVRFEGFVGDTSQKGIFYKASDVFVLPSTQTQECFAIVNLEAMASGVPIVASRIGGIPDVVIDGETGLLVTPKHPSALAEAVIRLLRDPELRNRMSDEGQRKVQGFSWQEIADQTAKVYEKVITEGFSG